ncbi:phage holin family protein [Paenibacillus naphthalenovorans]|uniref:Holin n=1 Tax=Paenibacillus naphthalenovorans TaxID=162209 RepID=A0A0U2WAE5_9BACL|nr:phage holin family protein [Paenibacillus naphthalenovorans]ALS22330.1 hypothetical protein IJ22_19560 [Paenibacillus naphthalenovorans]
MSQELRETFTDVWIYICKTFIYVKPLFVIISTGISYILFPHESYVPAAIALIGALILDVVTKYYSVGALNGGIKNAIKTKKLTSESLWRGTKRKIISVLVIMILCGLSYRLSPLDAVGILFTTVCYTFMFWREAQSIVENLIDAGHEDLEWLLFLVKKKQKEVLDQKNEVKDKDEKTV